MSSGSIASSISQLCEKYFMQPLIRSKSLPSNMGQNVSFLSFLYVYCSTSDCTILGNCNSDARSSYPNLCIPSQILTSKVTPLPCTGKCYKPADTLFAHASPQRQVPPQVLYADGGTRCRVQRTCRVATQYDRREKPGETYPWCVHLYFDLDV